MDDIDNKMTVGQASIEFQDCGFGVPVPCVIREFSEELVVVEINDIARSIRPQVYIKLLIEQETKCVVYEGQVEQILSQGRQLRLRVEAPKVFNRRAYFRVEDQLSFSLEKIDEAEVERFRVQFAQSATSVPVLALGKEESWGQRLPADLAEPIKGFLQDLVSVVGQLRVEVGRLSRKLDGISEQTGLRWMKISGAGFECECEAQVQVGNRVLLTLELPGIPNRLIKVIGDVMHCKPVKTRGWFHVGVKFSVIHESDRDEIIRFTFSKQREFLRQRRRVPDDWSSPE